MLLYCRRLHLPSVFLLWLLCSLTAGGSNALCPASCTCRLNDKGKRKVSCVNGGLRDPIPTAQMDPGMEVLEISAPDDNRNSLSITSMFQHFKLLEEVHISKSNVNQIGMHAFWGVPSLKILNLSFNNISAVLDHNFRGLVNLIELNLDNNGIVALQSGVFKHLTELRILSLQRNLLRELLPRTFLKLAKLRVLKLSGNTFDELDPEAFKEIPDLRVLECRACGLKRINTQIYHLLPYLSHLDLGLNQIQFLSNDEFLDLHRLHSLKLDGNLLPVILEKTFVNQHQLKYLCLARNRIVKITDTAFENLTSLTDLDIGYNKLSKIERIAFTHISETLLRLVISGNNLNLLLVKTLLNTLRKVWHLEAAQMKLKTIPENFFPEGLRRLDISRNNLTELTAEMLPDRLVELDVSDNELKSLNESALTKLELIKFVNLTGNRWMCDLCHITPIFFHLNNTDLFKNVTCAFPEALHGKKLTHLNLDEIPICRCPEENGIPDRSKKSLVVGLICILVFAVLSIIFVVFSCVRRHARNRARQEKRAAEQNETGGHTATAIFCKGEISFNFPLDLTERKMSVSTIDEIKKDRPHQSLPNGTGI